MVRKKFLLKKIVQAEGHVDRWRLNRRIRKGRMGKIIIFPYRGYGNEKEVTIMGRVMEDKGLAKPNVYDSTWTNIKAMFRRYLSREIPFVNLQANFQGEEETIRTDDEGYFHLHMPYQEPLPADQLWHHVHFELQDELIPDQPEISGIGEVMIPDVKSHFGIISDIDDTVLISKTTNRIEIIRMAMVHNATTRLPFHGVSAFYNALQRGSDGERHNPIFYVSSSPWNMYDLLEEFFRLNDIPKGPILLRDIGISETKFLKEKHASHKLEKIRSILSFYPDLPFILIGDSGQHDPEIYQEVVDAYPGRILSIYIRDVTKPERREEVKKIAEELAKKKVDLIIKEDTAKAATHAEKRNFIQQGSSAKIIKGMKKDEKLL
ncbi:App1 family protein [Catalinimonas niigatensis]|uniref:App1 family protein n=1 Tax=Catalinimonas niigatensis TaxID=1397264 RepID=UPI0026666CB3|nr:phosphatase domain-containing protein [Catalinimonas niigatensis]WPP50293.1 phosphatase domain-containing protein [Catalinimonas niigatensis]